MEVMEFALGLYVGLAAGYVLRGVVCKLELGVRHYGSTHGSKTKNRH